MELKFTPKSPPLKEWRIRCGDSSRGPLSLGALIILIKDEAFPASEAEVSHRDTPEIWKALAAEERLTQLHVIRQAIDESKLWAAQPKCTAPIDDVVSTGTVKVEDFIRDARLADTAGFGRKVGTPPKPRETDDENDVVNHLKDIGRTLALEKQLRNRRARVGEFAIRSLLCVKLVAASAVVSVTYFIMEGPREVLLGAALFLPIVAGIPWLLKKDRVKPLSRLGVGRSMEPLVRDSNRRRVPVSSIFGYC